MGLQTLSEIQRHLAKSGKSVDFTASGCLLLL